MKLDISSIEEDNIKAQELAFMLQTMGNNIDPALSKIVLRDIAKLRKMPALAHEIENWEPQPDPMQQQIQMLEIQKLQAEIQELHARAAENQTDAQLNVAKISTEQAKARQAASDADLKDLNYVEQESGVTQEREKELMGEQARSNIELKRAEHALESVKEQQTELRKYLSGGTQSGEE
jgi:hypothetical protein